MSKTLYCIRHGVAVHNVLYYHIGTKAYTDYRDTPLLHEGHEQAINLKNTWEDINKIELVLVSPCMRTLQTCSNIFDKVGVKTIALDSLVEHPFGGRDTCNKRKDKSVLISIFPWIDFSNINEVTEWPGKDESIEELEKRIYLFKKYVEGRPEKHIAVVGHSSYIGQMMNGKMEKRDTELKHCYPYIHKL
jgi:broad specificity phosphatase PhoE